MFIYNIINKMSDNDFEDYHVKIFTKNEKQIFGKFCEYGDNLAEYKIPIVYMPKMEITMNNLNKTRTIYYFTNYTNSTLDFSDFVKKKFNFQSVTKFNGFTKCFSSYLNTSIYFTKVHNEMMKYLQNTYMELKHIFITDIAKYIFKMYIDVIFG